MSGQVLPTRDGKAPGAGRARWALLALLASLALGQAGCLLTSEIVHYRYSYTGYVCRARLVDTDSGEQKVVDSSMLASTAPGAPARSFFANDWNGDGMRNEADALLDWKRYLAEHVLDSTEFAGHSWCARPSDITCVVGEPVSFVVRSGDPIPLPPALPEGAPAECPPSAGARLEVSAPGLTPEGAFTFPDTPVGDASAPVTFTVTNAGPVPLRVNSAGLLGGADSPDFLKSADTCAPTSAELAAMRGHFLAAGGTCTFQMQFRPLHRDGVPECADAGPDESCRRTATLAVNGELDLERTALPTVSVGLSGRAMGGRLVVDEPAAGEVCFAASVPSVGNCTESRVIRLRNGGLGELTIYSAGVMGGSGAGGFQQLAPATPPRLAPGATADLTVRFCNAGSGADGAFTINTSDHRTPTTTIPLVNPLARRCP